MKLLERYSLTMLAVLVACPSAFAVDLLPKKKKEQETPAAAPSLSSVVAEVNGTPITREELANELIETYGEKQLEMIIHRRVIAEACKMRGIEISNEEVNAEIRSTIEKLNVRPQEFRENILARRGLTYNQYIRDTVWPAIALKKLVEGTVEVQEEDLKKSFVANYGEKVEVRMFVVLEQRKAFEVWEEISKIEDDEEQLAAFEDACKNFSIDQATRPYGGHAIIHRHANAPDIEKLAFSLKPGELSKIIQVQQGHMILYCVRRIPENTEVTMETVLIEETGETVRDLLAKDIMEKKTRMEIGKMFEELSNNTPIKNYLTGDFDIESLQQQQKAN